MIYGLGDAAVTSLGGIAIAVVGGLFTIIAILLQRNSRENKDIRTQVTPNGGNTDSLGDRVVRSEKEMVHVRERTAVLETQHKAIIGDICEVKDHVGEARAELGSVNGKLDILANQVSWLVRNHHNANNASLEKQNVR